MKKYNKALSFVGLTLFISYIAAGIFYLSLSAESLTQTAKLIFTICYMFIPLLSAVLLNQFIYKDPLNESLLLSFKINKWFFVAWLIMPVYGFLTFGVSLLFPGISLSKNLSGMYLGNIYLHPVLLALVSALAAGITVNAILGFGEEAGWRGYLMHALKRLSFFKASLIIGFVWGIWHAPVILMGHNYPQHPGIGAVMMTFFCILLSPIFLYIAIKSRSSIAAGIMHGTLNGVGGFPAIMTSGGSDLTVGITGAAGFIALAIMLAALAVYDRYFAENRIMNRKIEPLFHGDPAFAN